VSKDYKKSERESGARGSGGSLLVGILIGLVLGLSIALGVAWYINKMPSPFLARPAPSPKAPAKGEPRDGLVKGEDRTAKAAPEGKPRFDFYKILPGDGQPAADPPPSSAQKASTAPDKDAFFLQAGAFQNAADADNLKARLALIGVEATIQSATLPDKGTWHRVRIGPYANVEALNSVRDVLKQNGYDTSLIKVPDAPRSK
jgi:cell division protein FtsN